MNQAVTPLFKDAQRLSQAELQKLTELLLDTLEPDGSIEKTGVEEAHARWSDHVAAPSGATDAFEAIETVRGNLKTSGDK